MSEETKSFIGGAIAGGVANLFYNPIELLKVRAQVNRVESIKYRKAIPELIRNEGYMGLYKGLLALQIRDIPGWGVYFWCYEVLKSWTGVREAEKNGTENSIFNWMIKCWCSGTSGMASWFVGFPMDLI